MLNMQNVSKSFDQVNAVVNFSLQVNSGEWRVLFGPSGCGKTTVLRLLAGLEVPDAGKIKLGDAAVSSAGWALPPWQRRVGFVFQESALWPHMNVEENISFGMHQMSHAEKLDYLEMIMEKTGVKNFSKKYPRQISGGQARRTALARALAAKPHYLLMDEPLSNLDGKAAGEMLELIKISAGDSQATMIYVTHNLKEAEILAAPVIRMDQGSLII